MKSVVRRRIEYTQTNIGNSARLRVPYKWLVQLGLPVEVELKLEGDKIVITPVRGPTAGPAEGVFRE